MTETERGLLRAICVDPAEDTPRLVYADYLEEAGERERAEFIRVQIDISRVLRDAENGVLLASLDRPELEQRERELYRAATADKSVFRWFEVPAWDVSVSVTPSFGDRVYWAPEGTTVGIVVGGRLARGFPYRIILPAEQFTERLATAFFRHLPLTEVTLQDRQPSRKLRGFYGFSADDEDWDRTDWLPDHLWKRLRTEGGRSRQIGWETSEGATEALSLAAVNWGRSLVGLNPLGSEVLARQP